MNVKMWIGPILDVLGIIFVIAGGLVTYAHAKSAAGIGLFWFGIVLLIVALILWAWGMMMMKPMMEKPMEKPMAPKM
jgi:drug/metabolite transporter (DMT)-like permease